MKSFEVLDYPFARDRVNVYEKGQKVGWLMPHSFEVIDAKE